MTTPFRLNNRRRLRIPVQEVICPATKPVSCRKHAVAFQNSGRAIPRPVPDKGDKVKKRISSMEHTRSIIFILVLSSLT
jgi:hypothetical protein